MHIENCTQSDFNRILSNIDSFWGSNRALHLHHPMLLFEFGNTAFVARESGNLCGYLFGFYSQMEPYAYAHLVAVHPTYRRAGIGRSLYYHFFGKAKQKQLTHIKAITRLSNCESITFHRSLGFVLIGQEACEGIPYVKNYGGPGEDRVVFMREL